MNPRRELQTISSKTLKVRLGLFLGLIIVVVSALVYTKFVLPEQKDVDTTRPSDAAEAQK